ncbi:SRPBCC family protein [Gordonia sp. X0973]|uniref:SRPBCC family protein n=1 Tax=Gordonia sp. X0973 TaxID=2742602 RepID=UPI000F537F87|nr:SRPBCC family protein [Gordonia sp. X0973]QKT06609.1 SRPBCC family protein [Gordonia sp. X0973]
MPYALQPITESFFDEAPVRYVIDIVVPADTDFVWREFTRQDTLDWCRALKKVTYTSPAPYNAKTTRTAVLSPGVVTLNEQFFIWDEDPEQHRYRHAFYGKVASVPGLKNFGEYTEVTPADDAGGGTRIVWKFALRTSGLSLPGFLSSPIAAAAFSTVKSDTEKHFS